MKRRNPVRSNPAPRRKKSAYASKALKALAKIESLAEAESRADIEALYAAAAQGKVEVSEALEEDITEQLRALTRDVERGHRGHWENLDNAVSWWEDDYVIEQIVKSIIEEYGHAELAGEIKEKVESDLQGHRAPSRQGRRVSGWSIFEIEDRRTGLHVAVVPNAVELYLRLDSEDDVDLLKIPTARVLAALEDAYSGEWTDTEGDGSAWSLIQSSDDSYVIADQDKLGEFVHDIVSKYYSDLFDNNPTLGREKFLNQLNELDPDLTQRLLKHAKDIPNEEWGNFAHNLWGGNDVDADNEAALEAVQEYLDFLETPPIEETDPQRLVGTIDFPLPDYARGRVDQARDEDRPPWRVIRLSPGELSVEGTRLRHCVGKKEMGYVRALAEGKIEIWSVRTPSGKPVFTMEVDAQIQDAQSEHIFEDAYAYDRGRFIKQVKGKVNRLPGFDGGSGELTRPQEVERLEAFFGSIDVAPGHVRDLAGGLAALEGRMRSAARPALRPNPAGGFDAPYRPLRGRP